MLKKVYLAGGIEGLPVEIAAGWRQDIMTGLAELAEFLDPMRRPLFSSGSIPAKEVVDNDLQDIDDCDLVVANLLHGACRGTLMEIGYAHANGKRVVILTSKETKTHPFFVQMASAVVTTMEEFVRVIERTILEMMVHGKQLARCKARREMYQLVTFTSGGAPLRAEQISEIPGDSLLIYISGNVVVSWNDVPVLAEVAREWLRQGRLPETISLGWLGNVAPLVAKSILLNWGE